MSLVRASSVRASPGTAAAFERSAARAQALAGEAPAAAELLAFAAGLCGAQASLARSIEATDAKRPLSGRLDDDGGRVLGQAGPLLDFVAESGPSTLREAARARREDSSETARVRLRVFWDGDRDSREDYLSRAILRPYVEALRAESLSPDRARRKGRCPFCGGAPWIGVRRDGAEMEGARRCLCCALCGLEWPIPRILCPACFEEDPYKLPSFQSEKHPAVRIEACETCRFYVKTIDLSQDATRIPEIDELISVSMDLWAAEQGLTRIEPGIAGL